MKKNSIILLAIVGVVVLTVIAVILVRRYTPEKNPREMTLDLGGGVSMQFILIQPGRLQMGSPDREVAHDASESPMHPVQIDKPFYIGKYEVTQGQWKAIMNSSQSTFTGEDKRPAENIAWVDAVKFCKYAGERTGRTMRLPSEAEWEYACRAATNTPWNSGMMLLEAVFKPATGFKPVQPANVGSRLPNSWGLYDMHGNVFEWCEDYYYPNYDKAPTTQLPVTTPPKLGEGEQPSRVYRGGSWRSKAEECRSATRFAATEETRSDTMGFRVVVEPR